MRTERSCDVVADCSKSVELGIGVSAIEVVERLGDVELAQIRAELLGKRRQALMTELVPAYFSALATRTSSGISTNFWYTTACKSKANLTLSDLRHIFA